MTDATPVGTRLATVAFHAMPNLPPAVYGPEIRDAIALALDDAGGVREAVWWLDEMMIVGEEKICAMNALAVLTGTQEVNRDR